MSNFENRNSIGLVSALVFMVGICGWVFREAFEEPNQVPVKPARVEEGSPVVSSTKKVKFVKAKPKPLPEVDLRSKSAGPVLLVGRGEAFAQLRRNVPTAEVMFDEISGAPSHLQATGRFLTAKNSGKKAADIVRDYVAEYPDLFGHPAEFLNQAKVSREDVTAHNGMSTLVWEQQHLGIRLYNTIFKANVTRDGEIVTLNDHFLPDPAGAAGAQDAVPDLTAEDAVVAAAAGLGDEVALADLKANGEAEGVEQKQQFTAQKLSDTTAHLTWLPLSAEEMRLAWDVVTFSLARNEMYQSVIDAETGEVLARRSLTADISDASYRVFTSDSPSPFSPGHANVSSVQPPEVPRQLVTLSALNTTASPNGWIDDGDTQTLGNNVDAHTDVDANNVADLPRPTSASRVFDFTADLTQAPSTYRDASVTNLFYWTNVFHDKMYELGFTETAGNFQTNNFGRGGLGNDAIQADAQDGSGTDNAQFSTPPGDGSPGRMQMFLWTGPNPDRDGDFEMEVVLHELAHGVTNRLVGGGVNISSSATQGMGEGWSDFYGLAMLAEAGDDVNGNWARGGWSRYLLSGTFTENYYYGGRRYPYTTNKMKNPLTLRDIDPTQQNVHPGIPRHPMVANTADQVHNMGNVWCVTLWEMRTNLILKHGFAVGNQLALRLVTDGCKLSPANPNFLQARDAIIQADLVNNAAANQRELWAAFAKRGMGLSATAPAATTTVGISEAYDVPDDLLVTPVSGFDSQGVAGGPFSRTSRIYTIQNNSTSSVNWTAAKTQSWTTISATSGTLAAGASTTINWSLNMGANSLGVGEQMDTLSITNGTTTLVQFRPLSLIVNAALLAQTITFPALSAKLPSAAPFSLSATASSSLPVTYTLLSGPATLSGNMVTLTGSSGAVTIRASQAGNGFFSPAADVVRTFVVGSGFGFTKVMASPGGSFTFGLKADGTLWTWGGVGLGTGILGDTSTGGRATPLQIGSATTWSDLAAGASHGLALRSNGTLWGWGTNTNGQVGDATTVTKTAPTQIGVLTTWAKIAAGQSHSAAIRTDGTLWLWGINSSNQLGDGTTTQRTSPGQLGTATNWVSVACGSTHTLAVNSSGELWAWGGNGASQLGDGTTTTSSVPLRIGTATNWASVAAALSSSYALKTDGTLWAWGSNGAGQLGDGTVVTKTTPTQIGTDTTWTQISAGANNGAGRKSDGSLWVWGSNGSGQFGNGTTTNATSPTAFAAGATDWAAISCGVNFITAQRNDGSLWTAGESSGGTGVQPRGLALAAASTSTWQQLTGTNGTFHAVRSDGTLWGFGANSFGQVGNASTTEVRTLTQVGSAVDWRQVSGGSNHTMGVKTGGTLWAWGSNLSSQLGDGTSTTRTSPVQIGADSDWRQVAAATTHTMAVKTTGTLWGWGSNGNGQLGDGTTTAKTVPTQIGTDTNWSKVAVGSNHTLLLKTTGTLWACGSNSSGQLGDGSTTQRTAPVQVGTDTNWTEIAAAGSGFSLALKSNGTLWSWGQGVNGQLGSSSTANRSAPVQVGTDTDWARISAGNNTTVAIKSNGTIWTCGLGAHGQLGDGQTGSVSTLARIGNETTWLHAAVGQNSLTAIRSDGFWTAGASAAGRTLAAGRDTRLLLPILPALQPQSFNTLAASYSTYQSPVVVSTTSGLTPSVTLISGPATLSGNQLTLIGNGTVVLTAAQFGDDSAWNSIPPTRMSFTVGNSLSVSFPSLGSTGLTSNGFDARNVVLTPTLGFAPTLGTALTLVNNTGSGAVLGTLAGIPQDGYLTMIFGGVTYGFRVDYFGGDGNDIVLTHEQTPQTITFTQISPKETTDTPFAVTATSTGNLPVTLSIAAGPATISGNTISLTGTAGSVTVKATQAGNTLFTAAPDTLHTFAVGTNVKFASYSTSNTGNHAVAVGTNGWLWAWGVNSANQLGDGTLTTRHQPIRIGIATDWARVAAGNNYSLAIKTNGTLWGWGSNTLGSLGDGTGTNKSTPTQIGTATNWSKISAGSGHTLALRTDGTLWATGANTQSQVGNGTTTNVLTFTQIGTATDWVSIATTQTHSMAIKSDGTLWVWGSNNNGQLGLGDTANRTVPTQLGTATNWKAVAGSLHSVGVRTDGTLWGWGLNSSGQVGDGTSNNRTVPVQISFATNWSDVGSGNATSFAVTTDGMLWSWGANNTGQIGDGTYINRSVPTRYPGFGAWSGVQGNTNGALLTRTDGTVWTLGDGAGSGSTGLGPRSLARAMASGVNNQISAGVNHNLVSRSDGTLWVFGGGGNGQLGNGTTAISGVDPQPVGTSTSWASVRAGGGFSMGIQADGTLWGWGANAISQLGDGTTTARTLPVQIGTASDWAVVAPSPSASLTSNGFTVAIKTNGTLWGWGLGTGGQLGDGVSTSRTTPTQIGTDADWSKVATGSAHTLAIKASGSLWAAGTNTNGQLGDGSTTTRAAFVQIGSATDWASVATYGSSSYAIKTNGTLWAWGLNTTGQLGDGSTTQRAAPVQIGTDTNWLQVTGGSTHAAAIKTTGTLWVWGSNLFGQLGDGATAQRTSPVQLGTQAGWVAVSAGDARILALRNDGSVWSAGANAQLRLASASGRSPFIAAPVVPALATQTLNTTPIGSTPYRFTASSGLPVQLSLVSGQATITGDQINVTGPLGTPVVLLAWQPGDEFAWNSVGPEQITIGTLVAPVITSAAHANVDGSGADLSAVVNPNGALTSVSFQYGTSPTLASFTTTASQSVGSGTSSSATPVFALGGLNAGVTYYYRATASNAGGTVTSSIQSFTTLGIDIIVEQPAATEISSGVTFGYGSLNMGTSSGLTFTLRNATPGTAVSIGTISLTGADAPHFVLSTVGINNSLSSGQSTTFSVSFTPLLQGSRSVTLSIPSNDPDENPFLITLTGTGVAVPGPGQTIFGPTAFAPRFVSDGPLSLLGFGSTSGLPVSLQIVAGGGGTLTGTTLTPSTTGGPVTIRISQSGGSGYTSAPDVYRTFVVGEGKFSRLAIGPMANHSVGIKTDGTLWAWGQNNNGQVGNGSTTDVRVPVKIGTFTNWSSAAAGADFTVAIRAGALWVWGGNASGQLGLGDTISRSSPTQVGALTTWSQVAAGADFVIAVQTNGTLWAWGGNASGQLGLGDLVSRNVPTQIGVATNWSTSAPSLAAGSAHALARTTTGNLFAWGLNSSGQLGLGDTSTRTSPAQVGTSTAWSKLACAANTSYSIQSGGLLWAWGSNNGYMVGDNSLTNRTSPVQISGSIATWTQIVPGQGHCLATRSDFSLWAWGGGSGTAPQGFGDSSIRTAPNRVGTDNDWSTALAAISGGADHSLGVKIDGSLWSAGGNNRGQMATAAPNLTAITSGGILAFCENNWANHFIRSNGTLWGSGSNFSDLGDGTTTRRPQPVQIGSATNWISLAGGQSFTLALRSDGTLWAAGINSNGQLGDSSTTTRTAFIQIGVVSTWSKISAGSSHSAGIRADGSLWTWGLNTNGQLGDSTTTQRSAPVQVGTATDWVAVDCGGSHTLALKSNGTLWAWGLNSSSQLGDGSTVQRTAPVQIGTDTNWAKISGGAAFSLAIKTTGSLWAWGLNGSGQLGDGSLTTRSAPVQIGTDTTWAQLNAGIEHSIALKSDGTAWGWGGNYYGQTADGTTVNRNTPAQIIPGTNIWSLLGNGNGFHTLLASADGTLWGIGSNADYQVTSLARVNSLFEYAHPGISTQTITFPAVTISNYGTPIPLTATASSGLPITYYVSGPASVSGNQLTVTGPGTVKILAYQTGERPVWHTPPLMQGTVMSLVEAWRLTNFGSTVESGATANTGDADGDGVANLFEFAFGTNPSSNASGAGVLVTTGGLGGGSLVTRGQPTTLFGPISTGTDYRVVFIRRKDHVAAGLIYTPQFSATLSSWQNSTTTPTVLADDGTYQAVSVPYPRFIAGKKARFFRMSVDITP